MDDQPGQEPQRLGGPLLASRFGLVLVFVVCGMGGSSVVLLLAVITGLADRLVSHQPEIARVAAPYLLLVGIAGVLVAHRLHNSRLDWYRRQARPSKVQARRALRLPRDFAAAMLALWVLGAAGDALYVWWILSSSSAWTILALDLMAGLATAGFCFLLADLLLRPAMPVMANALGHFDFPRSSVLTRVTLTWALASGIPLCGVLLLAIHPLLAADDVARGVIFLTVVGLVCGVLASVALARSVATPLHVVGNALRRIAGGELETKVRVDGASEIAMVQFSVNQMATSLRERNRAREALGRHVGPKVAELALNRQIGFDGQMLAVSALFVDVIGSTELAHEAQPRDFVARLNELFECVVEATDLNHGLVNKFEGDAVLCVFGAPLPLADDATSALRTAREIRRRVTQSGLLDVGVGVARGRVFAGAIGSSARFEYTVIGDAVNEASRLTETAKNLPARILASRETYDAASQGEQREWRRHGDVKLRGRAHPTMTYTT